MTVPNAPTLQSPSAQSGAVHLSWQDNSAHSTGFIVQRSGDNGATFDTSFPIAAGQTSYTDSATAANTPYVYQVIATDAGGSSLPSSGLNVLTLPGSPSNVAAISNTSSSAAITWTPDAAGAGGYVVERSSDGQNWSQIGAPAGSAVSFTDGNALAGHTYAYRVTATNATGSSAAVASAPVAILTGRPDRPGQWHGQRHLRLIALE